MIIADTNILARIITNDDLEQTEIAENILLNQQVYIPKTVFLELEWVLKSTYKMTRQKIYVSFW